MCYILTYTWEKEQIPKKKKMGGLIQANKKLDTGVFEKSKITI